MYLFLKSKNRACIQRISYKNGEKLTPFYFPLTADEKSTIYNFLFGSTILIMKLI